MLLSESQLNLFWRLWAAACRCQGWDREHGFKVADVNAKRHEVLQELGFASLTHVDKREGFDRVKARLNVLCSRIEGAVDEVDVHQGDRRRLLFRMQSLIRCLCVYMHPDEAGKYVHKICTDKFAWRGAITRGWEELDHRPRPAEPLNGQPRLRPSELEELIITISGRLNGRNGFRAKAEHSVHDMLTAAKLPCECAHCARGGRATRVPAMPGKPTPKPRPSAPIQEPVEISQEQPF